MPNKLLATDFYTAHDLAEANPGKIVNFTGELPCDSTPKIKVTQQIVFTPKGNAHSEFLEAVKGRLVVNSCEKGTFVTGTTSFNGKEIDPNWPVSGAHLRK